MAAPYNPPVKGEDFITGIALMDMSNSGRMKASPTIASGDFRISKDGGAWAFLATLPSVEPTSGSPDEGYDYRVKITLSATEMNADNVFVIWHDQTDPPEWADGFLAIVTTSA